jgi:hypothetical protein
MSRSSKLAAALFLLASVQTLTAAVSVQYNLVPVGGNVYRYVYTVTNDGSLGGGAAVMLFDILFDASRYQALSIVSSPNISPAQWSQTILSALPGVPAAYDSFALQGGIAAGTSVSGFAVQFTWLGPGLPGSQPFQISNPSTFTLLQSGTTFQPTSAQPPSTVPTASTWSLILIGVGLALTAAKEARAKSHGFRAAVPRL